MKLNKKFWLVFMIPMLSLGFLWPLDGALAQTGRYHDWQMMPGMMNHWGFGWYGGIFIIVFWILILVGLVFFVKWLVQTGGREKSGDGETDRALAILRERYARGEIDTEEFETKKKILV